LVHASQVHVTSFAALHSKELVQFHLDVLERKFVLVFEVLKNSAELLDVVVSYFLASVLIGETLVDLVLQRLEVTERSAGVGDSEVKLLKLFLDPLDIILVSLDV
jgi:hypothetical protein